jgi:glycosyltransferase involved in cell wall biosynthesis
MHIAMVVYSDLNFDFRVYREALALEQAGHNITIVAPDFGTKPEAVWNRFELVRPASDPSQTLRIRYPLFWLNARRALNALSADVIHAHDLDTLWPATEVARRRGIPVVYDSHEYFIEQSGLVGRPLMRGFWSRLERRLIRNVHRTITVSESIARELRDRYRLEEVTTLRNLPPFRSAVESRKIHQVLDLDPGLKVVLYQGGFLTDNGLAEQIEAVSTVSGAVMVLIGDGPCEAELMSIVRTRGLEKKIYFIDRVPFSDLHEYTCSADLGLCLIKGSGQSFYHSMPNKLFEYMMAGLPVLASNFPEMQAVVDESKAGRVTSPGDVQAVADTIRDMLADPMVLQKYAAAARLAAEQYCWERERSKLVQLYNAF